MVKVRIKKTRTECLSLGSVKSSDAMEMEASEPTVHTVSEPVAVSPEAGPSHAGRMDLPAEAPGEYVCMYQLST